MPPLLKSLSIEFEKGGWQTVSASAEPHLLDTLARLTSVGQTTPTRTTMTTSTLTPRTCSPEHSHKLSHTLPHRVRSYMIFTLFLIIATTAPRHQRDPWLQCTLHKCYPADHTHLHVRREARLLELNRAEESPKLIETVNSKSLAASLKCVRTVAGRYSSYLADPP